MASVLQLRPFDTSTAEGRSRERYRRAAWTMAANLLGTGLNVVTLLAAVPLTLPYLGAERFGIWMTIASLVGLLSFLDLGIGNGLVNHVARTQAGGDRRRLADVVSRGSLLLAAIGAAAWLASWPLIHALPLGRLFHSASAGLVDEARDALLVFAALFAASMPLGGAAKILVGMQRGWIPHGVKAAASGASLLALVVASRHEAGIVDLLLATYGVQVLFQAALPLWLAREGLYVPRGLVGGPQAREDFRALASSGGLFLVLQVGTMIGWGADALVVSAVLGPAAVATLAVAQRLFQFVTVPLSIFNAPLWSAYADAQARDDRAFVRATLARSMTVTLVAAAALGAALVAAAPLVAPWWVGHALTLPLGFLAIYALWAVVDAAGNAFGMFMNGVHEIRIQVAVVVMFCPLALLLKWQLARTQGLEGLVAGTLAAYVACVIVPYATVFRRSIAAHWRHAPAR